MTDMTATETRVEVFEIVKQKSSSAMKKVTILIAGVHKHEPRVTSGRKETTYDHINKAQGRLKAIAIGSRP